MSKVFLSFLGTSQYKNCNYYFKTKDNIVKNVKFIQEALIKLFCKDFSSDDKLIFFLTEEAEKSNWNDSDKNDNFGLYKRLKNMNLNSKIVPVRNFPTGKNENEIWEMFKIIYEQMNENDEIILDITYSFRLMPLLMLLILNYAKYMKNIKIKAIYYGALEALGPIYQIKNMEISKRDAPILDLTTFSELQDWTIATENFTKYANTDKMREIIKQHLRNKSERELLKEEKHFTSALADLTSDIYTSNAKSLYSAKCIPILKELYSKMQNDESTPKPFVPIIDRAYEKIKDFQKNNLKNGFVAVEWCINHHLVQQGYTILLETVISKILDDLEIDYLDRYYRDLIIPILENKKEIEKEKQQEVEQIKQHWLFNSNDYEKIKNKIIDMKNKRNYLNHAGIRKEYYKKTRIERNLVEFYKFFYKIFYGDKLAL